MNVITHNSDNNLKRFDPVYVRWWDAGTNNELGWQPVEDAKETVDEYQVQSAGLFLCITKKYLYLCTDASIETDPDVHTISAIPVGCIISLTKMEN